LDALTSEMSTVRVAIDNYLRRDTYPFEFNEQMIALNKANRDMLRAGTTITLVGSRKLQQLGRDINSMTIDVVKAGSDASDIWYDRSKDRPADMEEVKWRYDNAYTQVYTMVGEVSDEARRDLGF
jgi:hypothetical protein